MQIPPEPRPYLTREEVKDRLRILGFTFEPNSDRLPVDTPEGRKKATAIEELMADAIARWIGMNIGEEIAEGNDPVLELREFTEEVLFG